MKDLLRSKKFLLISGSAVVVIAISVVTALVLSSYLHRAPEVLNVPAHQIMTTYTSTYTADNLRKNYAEQKNNPRNNILEYTASDAPYALQVTATDSVTYSKKDPKAVDSSADLVATAETFLTTQGMKKTLYATTDASSQTTYTSDVSFCQITTFKAVTDNKVANIPAAFGIGCTSKEAITAKYNDINTLLTQYRGTSNEPVITHISRTVVGNSTTPVTVLYISTNETKMPNIRAYFVSTKDKPTYVGTETVSAANTDQKSVRSAELIKAMADPGYGAFLTQVLEKY